MRALEMLHFLGAIDDEGDLTDVGSRMADFPVDPHLSRTIIASSERSCLSEVLAVIAMLSVPPPFSRPRYAQKASGAADKAHKHFASGYGDHLSLLNAYQAYVGASSKADFCRDWEHFLSDRNMKQAENVRRQLAGIARKTQLADESSDMLTMSIRKAFVEGFFMQFLQHKPEWVLYHETVVTDRCYMRNATAIPPEMLIEVSPKFYHPDRCKLHDHAKKMLRFLAIQLDSEPRSPKVGEAELMFKAFADAKDRWKIDGATMKGYYLHSESGYLYIWHQATGVLYEHLQSTGQCQAVWSSAVPQLNAEIWTVLPLPPTDPASMQATSVSNGELPNMDVFINLTVAHEANKQIPKDLLQDAVEDFSIRWELRPQDRE
eukprot:s3398_g1.t1